MDFNVPTYSEMEEASDSFRTMSEEGNMIYKEILSIVKQDHGMNVHENPRDIAIGIMYGLQIAANRAKVEVKDGSTD